MARNEPLEDKAGLVCGVTALLILVAAAGCALLNTAGRLQSRSAMARVKASGAPTTWKETIPAAVPDEQNAAVVYEKAVGYVVVPKRGEASWALDGYAHGSIQKYRESETRVAEIIAANAQALRCLSEAASRPKCRFNRDWRSPIGMRLPVASKLRDLSRLACAQAVLRADRGDVAGALEAWSLNLAMIRHLGSDPTLTSQIGVRPALVHTGACSLAVILGQGRLPAEQCRALACDLEALNLKDGFIAALEQQRVSELYILDVVQTDPKECADLVLYDAPPGLATRGKHVLIRLGYRTISTLDRAALLRFWERRMALARKPYRDMAGQLRALARDIPSCAVFTRDWYCHTAYDVGSPAPAEARRDTAMAEVGLMRVGLGVAAYRTQIGHYPDTLHEVCKVMNWDVPEDPFSGKDFIYRREGQGYVLYSLSRDLDDDGGQAFGPAGPDMIPDRDIVWRVAR